MEKRLMLALTLSLVILFSFQTYMQKKYPGSYKKTANIIPVQKKTVKEAEMPVYKDTGKDVTAETSKQVLVFSDANGALKRIEIKEYRSKSGANEIIMDASSVSGAIFATSLDGQSQSYDVERSADSIAFSSAVNSMWDIRKTYYFDKDDYTIEMELSVRNISNSAEACSYEIIGGSYFVENDSMSNKFFEAAADLNGVISKEKRPRQETVFHKGILGWAGLKSRYFSLILKPLQQADGYFVRPLDKNQLCVGITTPAVVLQPNEIIVNKYRFYAGPNKYNTLKVMGLGFENIIDYGVFGSISKLLLIMLNFFFGIFKNWGISIVALSILVNMALFPLTMKSMSSMKKMQEIQPHMEKLKQQHKDNPQKLNKEIMELYKTHKVNPFGGCLPMILQMPIFIALYQALIRNVDLKGARFLWIKDLSLPDAVRIPLNLPVIGNSLNILPILMIGAMLVQQKLSMSNAAAQSAEQKQQQAIMNIVMPIMFGFIFYNFPSGLVLYWFTNSIFMLVGQRMLVLRKGPAQ